MINFYLINFFLITEFNYKNSPKWYASQKFHQIIYIYIIMIVSERNIFLFCINLENFSAIYSIYVFIN